MGYTDGLTSLADLPELPPEVQRALERRYRKGYIHGACHALRAFERRLGKREVHDWIYGPLHDWCYGDCDSLIIAPPVRKRRNA